MFGWVDWLKENWCGSSVFSRVPPKFFSPKLGLKIEEENQETKWGKTYVLDLEDFFSMTIVF